MERPRLAFFVAIAFFVGAALAAIAFSEGGALPSLGGRAPTALVVRVTNEGPEDALVIVQVSRADGGGGVVGDQATAVSRTEVAAEFRVDGERLVIGAWEPVRGRAEGMLRGDSAEVRLTLRVPASGAYTIEAVNDVGDVHLNGLLVDSLKAQTDVGSVIVTNVDLAGSATLISDVGDAILSANSVQAGDITVRTDVGNAEAELPSRADVGYDAHATTDVGEAVIRIGDTEAYESEGDGAGEDESARSAGFATKPTKVIVRVTSNVGDARITAD